MDPSVTAIHVKFCWLSPQTVNRANYWGSRWLFTFKHDCSFWGVDTKSLLNLLNWMVNVSFSVTFNLKSTPKLYWDKPEIWQTNNVTSSGLFKPEICPLKKCTSQCCCVLWNECKHYQIDLHSSAATTARLLWRQTHQSEARDSSKV